MECIMDRDANDIGPDKDDDTITKGMMKFQIWQSQLYLFIHLFVLVVVIGEEHVNCSIMKW